MLEQGTEALCETANLVALTILGVASFLTTDPWLFAAGATIELIYLVWTSRSSAYRKRIRSRAARNPRGVESLDRCLLIVSVAGIVVILFFGYGKHLLSHRWPYLTHAGGWEAGAIGWTLLFLFYYAVKFVRVVGKNTGVALLFVLVSFVFALLLLRAWSTIGEARPGKHVAYVFSIGICFLAIDLLSSKKHVDPKERALSTASLWWADVPMVVAFAILWMYLWVHSDAEHQDVFVSGIISCQLVISNVVFVVMEFGLLRPLETPGVLTRLLSPSKLNAKAPELFTARFETSKGPFVVEVTRAWSPHAADRFYNLVFNGYYDDVRFFRVVPDIMVQFGIHGNPAVNRAWAPFKIDDELPEESNAVESMRGMVSFVVRDTTQVFIDYTDAKRLIGKKEEQQSISISPFGKVTKGMEVVDALYSGYGKGPPTGPKQELLMAEGNAYLAAFPKLDFIRTARIVAT